MTVLVVVAAATGILLIFLGSTEPQPRRSALKGMLDRLVKESGTSWRVQHLVGSAGAGAVLSATVLGAVTGSSVVIVLGAFSGGAAPIVWLRSRFRKRRLAHRDEWPEAIALLASGVRAGLSLPEVVAGLADRGPGTLRPFFGRFRSTYRSTSSFAAALEALADDVADPIADRVISALKLADEVGGTDLVRLLRTLGDLVRDDLRVRKEIEARWAWTMTAARLAAAAPWVVLAVMATRPEAAAAYDSSNGLVLVIGGGVATVLGYRSMLRAARLPEEKRWRR